MSLDIPRSVIKRGLESAMVVAGYSPKTPTAAEQRALEEKFPESGWVKLSVEWQKIQYRRAKKARPPKPPKVEPVMRKPPGSVERDASGQMTAFIDEHGVRVPIPVFAQGVLFEHRKIQ